MKEKTTPFLSIVIANFNYGNFIDEAIKSIINQSAKDYEIIVIDGASSDNSVEIIRYYSAILGGIEFSEKEVTVNPLGESILDLDNARKNAAKFKWCSEKDNGQSHAFNKGFKIATGKFLTWLNADDVMFPDTISRLEEGVHKYPNCEWFASGCFWLDKDLKVIRCSRPRPFSNLRANNGEISVWAPSSFFSRSLYERAGNVDERFHYMMDTELWFRFYKNVGARYKNLNGYCFGLRLHPEAKMSGHNFASSDQANSSHPKWVQLEKERNIFREKYGINTMDTFKRALTTSIVIFILNKTDTLRFRGKHYRSCFNANKEHSKLVNITC